MNIKYIMYVLKFLRQWNSIKSSRADSRVRWMIKSNVSETISVIRVMWIHITLMTEMTVCPRTLYTAHCFFCRCAEFWFWNSISSILYLRAEEMNCGLTKVLSIIPTYVALIFSYLVTNIPLSCGWIRTILLGFKGLCIFVVLSYVSHYWLFRFVVFCKQFIISLLWKFKSWTKSTKNTEPSIMKFLSCNNAYMLA
jgi:hypothetical protein